MTMRLRGDGKIYQAKAFDFGRKRKTLCSSSDNPASKVEPQIKVQLLGILEPEKIGLSVFCIFMTR